MNPGLSDTAVCAADADILIRTAEAAFTVSLKMSQHEQGIVIQNILSHLQLGKPFSAFYRKRRCPVLIHDIDRAERPAVGLQGFSMILRRIAAAVIVGIRLYNRRLRKLFSDQFLHPGSGNDIRPVRLPGMKLNSHFSGQTAAYTGINLAQTFRR